MVLSNNEVDAQTSSGYRALTSPVIMNTHKLTIEPVVACFMVGDGIFNAIQTEFIQEKIANLYNYTLPNNVKNGTCSQNEPSAEKKLLDEIQAEASVWLMYFTLACALPSIFMTVIIGAWSDSVGRRCAILLSSAGALINLFTWTLAANLELPLEMLMASSFIKGLCGGTSLFVAACFSYISDVTKIENRTPRMIVCQGIILLSLSIAQLCGGFLLDFFDFTITFTISNCFVCLDIIYTSLPCLLRETIISQNTLKSFTENLKRSVTGIAKVLTKKDLDYYKTFLIINFVYFIAITFTASISAIGLLSIHFLGEPFCFSFLMLSYYTAVVVFIPAIGLAIAIVLKGWPDDYWLLHLSMCSAILFYYVCAAAETAAVVFIGAALAIFRALFASSCRSLMSKMSSPEEQGTILGFLGMTDTFARFISPLILNNIYSVTVYSMPTFVFWMCGSFCFFPILSIVYLQLKKQDTTLQVQIT